jgi:hypothetical protein
MRDREHRGTIRTVLLLAVGGLPARTGPMPR